MSNYIKVPGFDIYEVNERGVIRKITTKRALKPYKTKFGYYRVTLYKQGKRHRLHVHQVVAMTFIPNPDGKKQVNHIDGDKTNNNVSNLEWVTPQENIRHARDVLGYDPNVTKRRPVLCVETGEVFASVSDAMKKSKNGSHIWDAASGIRKMASGYHWAFVREA